MRQLSGQQCHMQWSTVKYMLLLKKKVLMYLFWSARICLEWYQWAQHQWFLDFSYSVAMAWHLLLLICRWSCNIKYLKLLYKVCDKPRHFFIHFSKLFIYWYFKIIVTKILRPCKLFWLKITAIFLKFLGRNEGSNKRNIQAKLTFFLEYNITMKNFCQSLKYTEWFVTEFLLCA